MVTIPPIQRKYQAAGQLFRDKRFPPVSSSLFYSSPAPNIEWRRPHQLCEDPRMFVDGVDRFDINQVGEKHILDESGRFCDSGMLHPNWNIDFLTVHSHQHLLVH